MLPLAGSSTSNNSSSVREDDEPVPSRTLQPNPIAAVIRQGAAEAGRIQGTARATTKVQRMINSLQWRQAHSKDELYPLPLDSGVVLEFRQLQAGEVTGLGTGATVWPAAHVLAKYLERRFGRDIGEGGMSGLRVVDLGSGTGVAGIVAAALGAEETFLTDQKQLLFLMEENAGRAAGAKANAGARAIAASTANVAAACGDIRVMTYEWGMDDAQLSPPLDVVLVSDCVLPKLYPIEPLVDAIDRLSGPDTVTIMSYEHRHYEAFDPRRRFEELASAKGLVKSVIPQEQQHPIFSADDIEIWEVRRRQQPQQQSNRAGSCCQEAQGIEAYGGGGSPTESALGNESDVVILSSPSTEPSLSWHQEAASAGLETGTGGDEVHHSVVSILGERHELAQTPSGKIGCYLWPSAVVMARHLVSNAAATAGPNVSDGGLLSGNAGAAAGTWSLGGGRYRHPARALELGSGVGLVAMAAALLGWEVVGTDKAGALPLLKVNVNRCLDSTRRKCAGTVEVAEYDWGADAEHLLSVGGMKAVDDGSAGSSGYDVVICADCVYARASVEPLLTSLCQVCDEKTVVLMTNELRSAFDEFLRRARALHFEVEDVHVPEAQMLVDQTSNQRPKPIALKRLRRRAVVLEEPPILPNI